MDGFHRPYARYLQRDGNTVGIAFTEAHPHQYGNCLYYVDFRDGAFFNVDGTKIRELKDGPLLTSEVRKVYVGSETKEKPKGYGSVPNSAWTCAMAVDKEGNPHIGYTLYLTNNDHRYRVASWNGSEWIDREIAYGGTCLYPQQSSYTGLFAFDPENPERVFISSDVNPSTGEKSGGTYEIYTALVDAEDDVQRINWEQVTSGSPEANIRPIVVSGEGYTVLIWMNGRYTSYEDYACDVKGIILER